MNWNSKFDVWIVDFDNNMYIFLSSEFCILKCQIVSESIPLFLPRPI